eukprot:124635-Pyramimonas_sp.AAC.1
MTSKPVFLTDLLGDVDTSWLRDWKGHMLRPPRAARSLRAEACPRGAYVDPLLKRNVREYATFLREAWRRGMLTWKHGCGGDLGLFFVGRKDERLRIIFDTRVINCDFLPAPSTRLPTPSAFGSLEADQE